MSEEHEHLSSGELASNIVIVVVCLVCAGLASGLTQGMLSLSPMDIEIKKRTGTPQERKQAESLIPLISRHHLLLVTLLLLNATAMEMLPLALDKLVPEVVAIILSVTMILFVGEILPAAVMTGPYQLQIVTFLAPFVYFCMFIFIPVSYPISLVLDACLGHDEGMTTYNRVELRTMVRIQQEFLQKEHREKALKNAGKSGDIETGSHMRLEINMIDSVLTFRDAVVRECMTSEVFMLSMDDRFSFETLNMIFKSGYSRFPVYEKDRNDVVGLLLTKDLLFLDPEDELPVRSVMSLFCRHIQSVWPDDKLHEVLATFKQHRSHMGIVRDVHDDGVRDPYYEVIGIITMEDIFEKVLGEDIMDETDMLDENNLVVKDKRREVGISKMRLLNPSMFENSQRLSEEEVAAITAHLELNVPSIAGVYKHDAEAIRTVVRGAIVVEVSQDEEEESKVNLNLAVGSGQPIASSSASTSASAMSLVSTNTSKAPDVKYLIKRGVVTNFCILMLSGKLTVLAGKDNFKAELGPWSAIGQDCLLAENGTLVPDFSAYISSKHAKYLKIQSNVFTERERAAPVLSKRRSTYRGVLEKLLSADEMDPNQQQRVGTPSMLSVDGGDDNNNDVSVSVTSPAPSTPGGGRAVPGLLKRQSFSIRRKQSLRGESRELDEAMEVVNPSHLVSHSPSFNNGNGSGSGKGNSLDVESRGEAAVESAKESTAPQQQAQPPPLFKSNSVNSSGGPDSSAKRQVKFAEDSPPPPPPLPAPSSASSGSGGDSPANKSNANNGTSSAAYGSSDNV